IAAGLVGLSRERLTDADSRRSTFLSGPGGARGLAEALGRLGVRVETFRRPIAVLDSAAPSRTLTAFVGPTRDLDASEGRAIAGLRRDLLLAGPGASAAIRCLGWDVRRRVRDTLPIASPAGAEARPFPGARAILLPRASAVAAASADARGSRIARAPGNGRASAPAGDAIGSVSRTRRRTSQPRQRIAAEAPGPARRRSRRSPAIARPSLASRSRVGPTKAVSVREGAAESSTAIGRRNVSTRTPRRPSASASPRAPPGPDRKVERRLSASVRRSRLRPTSPAAI